MDYKHTLLRITCWTLLKLHLVSEADVFNANLIVKAHRLGLRIKAIRVD